MADGTPGNDSMTGTAGADSLSALEGDDTLNGLDGNDTLNGGAGDDTVVFSGSSSGYNFRLTGGNIVVTDTNLGDGNDGQDTLISAERLVFADATIGVGSLGEVRVNSEIAESQAGPAVTALSDGGFVVVWHAPFQDGDGMGIHAQRYDAGGTAVGGEIQVNTITTGNQAFPRIAALPDGGFVVTWQTYGNLLSDGEVYARCYDAAGIPAGAEFEVNATTADAQVSADVAALSDGGFVVTWMSRGQDGSEYGIYARRYDATGTPADGEFQVNTTTAGHQVSPFVSALLDGGFVVSWESAGGIFAQRYDAASDPVGGEFRVDSTASVGTFQPEVASLPDGGFLVTWTSIVSPGGSGDSDILAQRYDADGEAVGGAFRVNTTSAHFQEGAAIATLPEGGFVVSWLSYGPGGSDMEILAQRYDVAGATVGNEFRINSTTTGNQSLPDIAALPDGGFVATWTGNGPGDDSGVFAQRYNAAGVAVSAELTGDAGDNFITWTGPGNVLIDGGVGADTLAGGTGHDYLDGGTGADSMSGGTGDDHFVVDDAGDTVSDSTGTDEVHSSVSFILPANVERLTLTGTDQIDGTGQGLANTLTGNAADNSLAGAAGDDTFIGGGGADTFIGGIGNDVFFVDSADDVTTESAGEGTDTVVSSVSHTLAPNVDNLTLSGDAPDGTGNNSPNVITGTDAGNSLNGGAGNDTLHGGLGDDTAVFDGSSSGYNFRLTGGNIVVTDTNPGDGNDGVDTLIGVESASFTDGSIRLVALGEQRVNTTIEGSQTFPDMAVLADGTHVVVWQSQDLVDFQDDIFAQRYDSTGVKLGTEFQVSSEGSAVEPVIAALSDGGFLVTWMAVNVDGDDFAICARRFDATGQALGDEFVVNTTTADRQGDPAAVGLANGAFVIAWEQDGDDAGIYARIYDGDGVAQGPEFNLSVGALDFFPDIAGLPGGGFVVAWQGDDGSLEGVFARRYADDGTPLDSPFRVSSTIDDRQFVPTVAALADGGFVVTWSSAGQDVGTGFGIYAQRYDAAGDPVGGEFRVNTTIAGTQAVSSITGLPDGGFVVTWQSPDANSAGIFGQRFHADGSPAGVEFAVNTFTAGSQDRARVTAMSDGGFLVTWNSDGQDGNFYGIYSQRYDAVGNPLSAHLTGDGSGNALNWFGAGNVMLDGGAGADTLAGGTGNDYLVGGAGGDSMAGGAGNDRFVVDDAGDVATDTTGIDEVSSSVTHALSANIENLVLTGSGEVDGTGNNLANLLEGNESDNRLEGQGGNDTFIGGGGADTFDGGLGDDLFHVDSADDVVLEDGGEGVDTVLSSVSHALGANVDNLILTGDAPDGSGNHLANTMTGNDAGNELAGGGDDDTLHGGLGDDTAVFDGGSSGYSFSLSGGNVIVTDTNLGDGDEGTDTLTGIEAASFADGTIRIGSLGEELVNTHTSDVQFNRSQPIAVLQDGSYVVTWTSTGQDGSEHGIYAQRYDAGGAAVGAEFRANATTDGSQENPSVAALEDGGFVIVWDGEEDGASTMGIFGQRYDAGGSPVGGEFTLSTTIGGTMAMPVVAGLADGGFVAAWMSFSGSPAELNVLGQRFDATGSPVGATEFQVSSHPDDGLPMPHIAALADGGFVVTWETDALEDGNHDVLAQRYDASGNAVGDAFRVNSETSQWQSLPEAAGLPDGGFVIAWTSPAQDGDLNGIFAQRYDAVGVAVSGEFQVNVTGAGDQYGSSVTALEGGGYVIAWHSGSGSEFDVYARIYDSDGAPAGNEFLVNTTTTGLQSYPAVAAMPDGGFVVTWNGNGAGDADGIFSQRFDAVGNRVSAQLTGDDAANVITWVDAANAILDGGGGNDTLEAGAGDDRLAGGNGSDTASYASAPSGVSVDLSIDGPQDIGGGAGSDTLVDIENLAGSAHDDLLSGDDGANHLAGADGDDTLVGGTGSDTLDGGAGIADWVDFSARGGPVSADLAAGAGGGLTLIEIENLLGSGFADELTGSDAANLINGGAGADSMAGGANDDRYVVDDAGDEVDEAALAGTDQIDASVSYTLSENVENLLLTGALAVDGTGNAGANVITGNGASNTLNGVGGNDTLTGGAGDDVFVVATGEGVDRITDFSDGDAVRVTGLDPVLPFTPGPGTSVGANQVQVSSAGGVTTLHVGLDGTPGADVEVQLTGVFSVDQFRLDGNDIVINHAPTVADLIDDQGATEDDEFEFTVSAGTFEDPDGDALSYLATYEGGALPGWLEFDGGGLAFSGTPDNGDVGFYDIEVTANDASGASVSDTFRISVVNTNDAPSVGTEIADQNATEDSPFGLVVPESAFTDVDVIDSLLWSVTTVSGGDLPNWLDFDPDTRTFSGTPQNGDVGEVQVRLRITDSEDANAFQDFKITVANTNDAPVVDNLIADINGEDAIQINNPFEFVVPVDTFDDVDAGDSLELSASLAGGGDLPGWLSFDPVTATFGGTPLEADIGALSIEVTATDESDASVSDIFLLQVVTDDETIVGGNGNDSLQGGTGEDTLLAGAGNDTLDGGTGADSMVGGNDNDLYFVDHAADVIVEQLGAAAGADEARSSVSYVLPDDVEVLVLTGASAIDGTGNNLQNLIVGNDAANRLDGGGANAIDDLRGGDGNDTYVVDNSNDVIVEAEGKGQDSVEASADYVLPAHVENIALVLDADRNATGNALANVLTGNTGHNELEGLGENDTIFGGDGNDTLDGGTGADSMLGGDGDDVYIVDNDGDSVVEDADAGEDLVRSSVTRTLGANQEDLTLTGTDDIDGTGNELDNDLVGNDGDNELRGLAGIDALKGAEILDGSTGADTFYGGQGSDFYYVDSADDVVIEEEGEGNADTIYAFTNLTLPDHVERVEVIDTNAYALVGNGLANIFRGNIGNDTLDGGGGNDTLEGGAGADELDGGTGADSMKGGAGDDLYYVDNAGDVLVETAGAGELVLPGGFGGPGLAGSPGDTVKSAINYALKNFFEHLELTGSASRGTGNSLANSIKGNAGADTLSGAGGNDTLDGGSGNDLLLGGGGNDRLIWGANVNDRFDGGADTDTLRTTTSLNLTQVGNSNIKNVEQIDLNAGGGQKLTLNASDVLDLSGSTNTIKVLGTSADSVDIVGSFTRQGLTGSGEFRIYKVGTGYLQVDTDILSVT